MPRPKKATKEDTDTKRQSMLAAKDAATNEKLNKLKALWEQFSIGTRVYKKVYIPVENTVFCQASYIFGVVSDKMINPGGLPQVWVIWDGSRFPVLENPDTIRENW